MDTYNLRYLHTHHLLQDIDLQFAELLATLSGEAASDELSLAAALVSNTTAGDKHICLDLAAGAARPLSDLFPELPETLPPRLQRTRTPDAKTWTDKLRASPVVGSPGDYRPLVLDDKNRLYLYRYWHYEHQLAAAIKKRTGAARKPVDLDVLQVGLQRYFTNSGQAPDWQKAAAFAAVTGNLCVISGGPGTGKTHTVTHILALLLEQDHTLRIAVCAPTGKAAARIQESIKKTRKTLACPPELLPGIPEEAVTIHRLLGVRRDSPHFYHDHENPLPLDVLIVDEASMVSLALMTKLIRSAAVGCRIILLGDKNQLASVEAGAVLGDICAAADTAGFSKTFCEQYAAAAADTLPPGCTADDTALSDCAVELRFSYRFDEKSAIGAVSRAVNSGDAAAALRLIRHDASGTIALASLPEPVEMENRLQAIIETGYAKMFRARSVPEAFYAFETFRILCSHRRGMYGVEGINRLMETLLHKMGLIDSSTPYYPGRPIMINRNDYSLGLYNGDIGIVRADASGESRVWFPDRAGGFRALLPARLPAHETVYAMTIHKSQGSEFDRILMVLPAAVSPIFTRELVYTGITRARRRVEIWATAGIFETAVSNRVARRSGLRDALSNSSRKKGS